MSRLIKKVFIEPVPFKKKIVRETIKSKQFIVGPNIDIFKRTLSHLFKYEYVNTVSNGFSALFIIIKALNLNNKKIIIPSHSTCFSIPNAVLSSGNIPIYCNLDPNHLSISEKSLSRILDICSSNEIGAIIAPSHFGIPAPVEAYKNYNLPVIEDACQALMTRTKIYSNADFLVLSLYPTKYLNCIDGGVILTNNKEISLIIDDICSYNRQKFFDGKARYNFSFHNINAAIGIEQLKNLDKLRKKLLLIKERLLNNIDNESLTFEAMWNKDVIPWRFLIRSKNGFIYEKLQEAGFECAKEFISFENKQQGDDWTSEIFSIPYHRKLRKSHLKLLVNLINKWA